MDGLDMAIPSESEIRRLYKGFQRYCNNVRAADPDDTEHVFGAMEKTDLYNAVVALLTYIDNNRATINQAIPQPARAEMTATMKGELFAFCALLDTGNIDLLKRIVGEVD
jgi:hypothetical protein